MCRKKLMNEFSKEIKSGKDEETLIRNIKHIFCELSIHHMQILFREKQPLDANQVENGSIYYSPIGKIEQYEFSALELLPGAKIKKHLHAGTKEYYLPWKGATKSLCQAGEKHEFQNNSNDTIFLLSVKIYL